MTNAYTIRDRLDLVRMPRSYADDGDLAITLDLLVNGEIELPDPYGPGSDVFMLEGRRYRPVRWDLEAQALICWRVP